MRVKQPAADQLWQLPSLGQYTVPSEWEVHNNHVNVKYYMMLYEMAGWPMVTNMGMDEAYFHERRCGLFDLEYHIRYVTELHAGDQVSIYSRLVNRTGKRFHGLMFILNNSRNVLVSSLEFVTSGANLDTRRTAAFPDDIGARLDSMIEEHCRLPWSAPLCGVMSA